MRFLLPLFLLLSCTEGTRFYSGDTRGYVQRLASSGLVEEIFEIEDSQKYPLDILIVVDASSSMRRHLDRLGKSLTDLLFVTSNYDWQIAFTTADHGDHRSEEAQSFLYEEKWENHASDSFPRFGNLMFLEREGRLLSKKILTADIPSYEKVFYNTLSHHPERKCSLPPFCHNYLEQPLRSLKSALERSRLDNGAFFRPSADFVSLIITNEDERDEDSSRATSAREVVQTFKNLFHAHKKFLSFGILVKDQACLSEELRENQKAKQSVRVAELARLTGGENISICSKDYGPSLRKISLKIRDQMEQSLVLEHEPFTDSVQVRFLKGSPTPWVLSGKRLIFKGNLDKDTQISIRYQASEG